MIEIVKQVKLVPLKEETANRQKHYYEQVLLYVEGYPSALFHIDTLWESGPERSPIYEALNTGDTLTATLTISLPEPPQP